MRLRFGNPITASWCYMGSNLTTTLLCSVFFEILQVVDVPRNLLDFLVTGIELTLLDVFQGPGVALGLLDVVVVKGHIAVLDVFQSPGVVLGLFNIGCAQNTGVFLDVQQSGSIPLCAFGLLFRQITHKSPLNGVVIPSQFRALACQNALRALTYCKPLPQSHSASVRNETQADN